jgi:hypothetical protein
MLSFYQAMAKFMAYDWLSANVMHLNGLKPASIF